MRKFSLSLPQMCGNRQTVRPRPHNDYIHHFFHLFHSSHTKMNIDLLNKMVGIWGEILNVEAIIYT